MLKTMIIVFYWQKKQKNILNKNTFS